MFSGFGAVGTLVSVGAVGTLDSVGAVGTLVSVGAVGTLVSVGAVGSLFLLVLCVLVFSAGRLYVLVCALHCLIGDIHKAPNYEIASCNLQQGISPAAQNERRRA